jgi:uncharacterized membrane protein
MNYSQIRAEAWQRLNGHWTLMLAVWVVVWVIMSAANMVALILGGPLMLGVIMIFLNIYRREDYKFESMFNGFKDISRSLVAYLLMSLYVFLWMLLFIVPGIIASISYSMTFFILADDKQIQPQEALRKSRQMMHGHKTEFFLLMLSFIGWAFLSILTMGIGFLWLSSYMCMAQTIFYHRIKDGVQPA